MSTIKNTTVFTPFFKDENLQRELEEKGYVIIKNFLTKNETGALFNSFNQLAQYDIENFHVSNYGKDYNKNVQIDKSVKDVLLPVISRHLKGYRPMPGLFYIKPANKKSKFHIHIDWSIVDERYFSSLHVWVALCDITNVNGNLFMFEGSHKYQPNVRGCPGFEYPAENITERFKRLFTRKNIYLNEGDAIIFDHRIRHGSLNNNSDKVRVAAGISVIPENTSLVHYHKHKNGKIEMFEVADDFYLDFNLLEAPKTGSKGFVTPNFFSKQ